MNTGGPAFPGTLLDWFAAQALVGFLVYPYGSLCAQSTSKSAYDYAEAMLAEKSRREAVVKESSTADHFGEANKMVELEKQNRELVERIKQLEDVLEKAELAVAFANREHGVIRMMADDYTEVLQQIRVALRAKEAKP